MRSVMKMHKVYKAQYEDDPTGLVDTCYLLAYNEHGVYYVIKFEHEHCQSYFVLRRLMKRGNRIEDSSGYYFNITSDISSFDTHPLLKFVFEVDKSEIDMENL